MESNVLATPEAPQQPPFLDRAEEELLMWMRSCALCGRKMTKLFATDSVSCACGQFVWDG
jgi:hypothetical protein